MKKTTTKDRDRDRDMDTTTQTEGNPAISPASVRDKLADIRRAIQGTYRERERAVEVLLLAVLSRSHVLLVGPPGTAKSALLDAFLASVDGARWFRVLVSKFSTEDEVFGPVAFSALKADRYERVTAGRLAEVEFAFVDEIFKSNSSLLNAMLSALNERLYAGKRIPLRSVVAASNELPETDEGLEALYDRILVRDVVGYLEAESTWLDVVLSPPVYRPQTFVTLADLDAACAAVDAVAFPERVGREMARIRRELKTQGIVASDRRWIALTRVLRASAWLDGETEVQLDNLQALRFGLWNKPEERDQVVAVLDTLDRSAVQKAVEIADEALRAYANRPTDPKAYRDALGELAAKVTDAGHAIKALLADGVSRAAQRRIMAYLDHDPSATNGSRVNCHNCLKCANGALKKDLAARLSL